MESITQLKRLKYLVSNKIKLFFEKNKRYNIKSINETIDEIIKGKSISRYGDGEFSCVLKNKNLGFQSYDKKLSERLNEILKTNLKNHLVAIPSTFNKINNLTNSEAIFWSRYYIKNHKNLDKILDLQKIYYDAMITRFYLPFKNKKENIKSIEKLKNYFFDKKILIIEGENTRFGVDNNLLKNVKSVKRILAPSKNAFSVYDKLLEEACKFSKDTIILIALGPTATVLAYDLCKEGYQAIDIGHLDIEYEWYLSGAKKKVEVKYKDVGDIKSKNNKEIDDLKLKREYEEQIYLRC